MDTLATKRVHILARLAFVWAALIAGRLIQLQVVQHSEYTQLAQRAAGERDRGQAPRAARFWTGMGSGWR